MQHKTKIITYSMGCHELQAYVKGQTRDITDTAKRITRRCEYKKNLIAKADNSSDVILLQQTLKSRRHKEQCTYLEAENTEITQSLKTVDT